MTVEESSPREGYGARAAARCTQTRQWSPAGSGELVCWEVSPCLSCFCSSSSADRVLPTAGPEKTHQQLEERIRFQVLFTWIRPIPHWELWLYTCSNAGAVLQGTHTHTHSEDSRVKSAASWEGCLFQMISVTWHPSNWTEGCNLQAFQGFTAREKWNQPI